MTPDQRARAACRGADTAIFFPPLRPGLTNEYLYAPARAICARCPDDVRAACLAEALADEDSHGFRGGTAPGERGRMTNGRAARHRVCEWCGHDFRSTGRAVYCGNTCRTAACGAKKTASGSALSSQTCGTMVPWS